MAGLYQSVAKSRAYLLLPVVLAVREESCCRRWQIPSRFARTKQLRDEGRKRGWSWLVQAGARHLASKDIYVRDHANLTDDTIRRVTDCTLAYDKAR